MIDFVRARVWQHCTALLFVNAARQPYQRYIKQLQRDLDDLQLLFPILCEEKIYRHIQQA